MAVKALLGVIVGILIVGVALGFYTTMQHDNKPTMTAAITSVTIGTTTIAVEVADTEAARSQGLSGRTGLPQGGGMLFVFDAPTLPGFWMKDMLFDLDMVFINASGTVVTLDKDVSADSYRKTPPDVFYPSAPVNYVLEVPAGFAATHGIVAGQTASFK